MPEYVYTCTNEECQAVFSDFINRFMNREEGDDKSKCPECGSQALYDVAATHIEDAQTCGEGGFEGWEFMAPGCDDRPFHYKGAKEYERKLAERTNLVTLKNGAAKPAGRTWGKSTVPSRDRISQCIKNGGGT